MKLGWGIQIFHILLVEDFQDILYSKRERSINMANYGRDELENSSMVADGLKVAGVLTTVFAACGWIGKVNSDNQKQQLLMQINALDNEINQLKGGVFRFLA